MRRHAPPGTQGRIRVGTASWSDPGFIADWYPRRLPPKDRLRYYAEHFDLVELNASFYHVPEAPVVAGWCEQTPPGFLFDVKLHQLLSRHSAGPESLPPDLRGEVEVRKDRVLLTPRTEVLVARRFLEGIAPLRESGKLGALLLQLSPSFGPRHHDLEELDPLLALLEGYRVAVELRNRSWVDEAQAPLTLEYFIQRGLSYVTVDAPASEHFMVMPPLDVVTSPKLAYLRAHGRNAPGYVRGRTVAARFDYEYGSGELDEILSRTVELAGEAAETHVIYNNNKSNYAPRAAETFRALLGQTSLPGGVESLGGH